jgi:4-hydroxybenzoyl-CoA reductase subunit alpha
MSTYQSTVGSRFPLIDSMEKSTGQGIYIEDMRFPDMLHARLVRSPTASMRIDSVDFSDAAEVEGFIAGLAPGEPGTGNTFGVLPISEDETPLPSPNALYSGALVAAVACETEVAAREAALKVRVNGEVLTPVLRPKDALKETDTPIHANTVGGTNIHKAVDQEFGDVDGAFKGADVVTGGEYVFDGINHGFTEPIGCIAVPEANGRLSLYSATQVPHYLHRSLAKVLEMPMHRIRVYKPLVGGGFGGKSDPFPHEMVAALLARKTGRPVKMIFDRDEVFLNNHGRHPTEYKIKVAADREGRLLGLDAHSRIDGGAWGSFGVVTTYYNGVLSQGPYRLPSFRYSGRRVYTNKPASGAMRGHGAVNARYALETALDEMAEKLSLDPFDLRAQNALPANTTTLNHLRITSTGFLECLERARERSGWNDKFRKMPYGKGIGLGCGFYISGSALPIHRTRTPQSTVHIKIDVDGGVTIHSLAADIGQGSDTMLAQCVAEAMGVNMNRCRVFAKDTDTAPIDLGSYSSRVTFMAGNAALRAGEAIFRKLQRACASLTGKSAEGFVKSADEAYTHLDDPGVVVPFMDALREALADNGALIAKGAYRAPKLGGAFKGSGAGLSPSYSYQAFVAEVDVDAETGFVRVEKIWAAHDCGKALNRLAVEGQLEGSVHMGMGQALTEQMLYLNNGQLRNPSFLDYKIPSPVDTPEIEAIVVESNDPEGPLGAKECGEGALAPIIPAIGNAIYDAIGVRLHEVPMTPERVLKAIEQKRKAEEKAGARS